MSKVMAYLHEKGLQVSENELVDALTSMVGGRFSRRQGTPLSARERDLLERYSGIGEPSPDAVQRASVRTTAAVVALVATAPTTNELAARLGIDPSRVRHRATGGSMYAIRTGRQKRYPAWQFGPDGDPLPGLKAVLSALPGDLHPLSVQGFMTTPQPEFEIDGREVSAAEWLAGGGDVGIVVELAASLDLAP